MTNYCEGCEVEGIPLNEKGYCAECVSACIRDHGKANAVEYGVIPE